MLDAILSGLLPIVLLVVAERIARHVASRVSADYAQGVREVVLELRRLEQKVDVLLCKVNELSLRKS